jgi:hypothetical protein
LSASSDICTIDSAVRQTGDDGCAAHDDRQDAGYGDHLIDVGDLIASAREPTRGWNISRNGRHDLSRHADIEHTHDVARASGVGASLAGTVP